ncbi:PAS domain S-box protein [Pedobacter frigidisoli]|uniref:PAS domain S-box protein n=1 Tax=Pedobacter frigidisoli TaxID=2530455 RepID=A0A4R0NI23_9SPHI|nr:PAS domain S-box protein [Pedobacter frigidisoli]TCD00252.1 PAS domain S-box protein [Pedobacter frigidisoli]
MKATSATTHKKSSVENVVKENSFPVVAIGASAGGLEAITELLKNLPSDTGMSFIYVQHLSPDHKSMLTEILSKHTKMKVQEIDQMDKIEPDSVFIIPHDKGIEVTDGHIKLIPRAENSSAISIDILFSSLAHAQKELVIGVILSGSGSDGTAGMKAIKLEGGLTFAQDDTAKFASMPQSAIVAGAVDFILSPKEIALELARLSKHPFIKSNGNIKNTASIPGKVAKEDLINNNNPDLENILNHLQSTTGVDFSQYKMTTIKRRIIRRMFLYKIETLKEYADYLDKKNEEIDILYQDLLINVTSFFRDTDTHKYLEEHLFPKLLDRKKTGQPLRIWVPACASGEEAYSIAMILLELQESRDTAKIPVQIFATDLSAQAISKARIGIYSKKELETVSPERIENFFTKTAGGYRVSKSVREMCVFAPHNILRDPPYSRLDFISCCNLFIYFDVAAQKKAMNTFHYALNDDGFLMLGKSETISQSANLFTGVNKKYKIFSRKINSGVRIFPQLSQRFANQTLAEKNIPTENKKTKHQSNNSTMQQLNNVDSAIDTVLLSEFMPSSVAINHQMEIVQFRGATELFLTHPKGKANLNILKMARPEIAFELRTAIAKAIKTKKRMYKGGIEIKTDAAVKIISVEVVPLKIQSDEPLLLILFTEHMQVETFSTSNEKGKNNSVALDRRIKKLEEELAAAHADALSFTEEQEAYIEELQSASEEVVSSNEELQTVNEELETSKEEIESANEELITTNQELQMRNDLLNESYDFTEAVVATIHDSMIVLDKNLRIVSASKSFYKNFGVTDTETEGMLLYDLGNRQWNIPRLREFLEDILPKNSHFEDFEVTHNFPHIGEKIMMLNASRIVQKSKREPLILLSIQDITDMRDKANELQAKEKKYLSRFQNLLMEAPAIVCVLRGPTHIYELANANYIELVGHRQVVGKPIREALPELEGQGFYEILDAVYKTGKSFFGNEMPVKLIKGNGKAEDCYVNFVYQASYNEDEIDGILVYGVEVTEQVNARKKIEESEQRFQAAVKAVQGILWTNNASGEMEGEQVGWALLTGQTNKEYQGYGWTNAVHPDDVKPTVEAWNEAVKERKTFIFEHRLKTKNGEWRDFSIRAIPLLNDDGILIQWVGVHTDITDKKQAARSLKANEEKLNIVIEASELGTYELNLKTKDPTYSKRYLEILGGYKEDIKLTHAQLLQHLHPDDFHIREKAFKEAIISGYLDYEARLIWNDKSIHWMKAKGRVFYNEENNPEKLLGTIRDITKERNHQQELEESEERFRNVADSAPVLIWMSGTDKLCYFFNKGWLNFTGRTMEEESGNGWADGVHPDDLQRCLDIYLSSFDKREPFYMEYRLKRHDREYRWLSDSGVPRFTSGGVFEGYIGACMDINEQKKAEEQFKALADQAPMWVWLTDKEVNILYTNPEVLKFIGIAHYSEFTGNMWEQKVHPEDIGMVYQSFAEAVSLQKSFSFDFRVLNASTQQYEWFYLKAVPRMESGEFTGFIGTAININEQRLIISQLEYRKALLEAHNEASIDGILLVDTKGKILSYNHRFVEIWNMPQPIVDVKDDDAALTFALTQLVHPEQFIEKVKRLYEHPDEISIDELEFKDGRIIERYGYPVAAADGSYYAWSWMFRDITQQREYERAIMESEETFRLLADSMPQQIWTSDTEGNLNYYNQSVFDYSGLSLEQINEDGWIQIVHPDDREENIKQWLNAISTGEDFLVEHRFRRHDGEYRWQLSRAIPQRDANGKIQMWVGTSTDIQEQKTREEKKDEFISIASHEMKTPLTTANGYLQILERLLDQDNANASLYAKKARQSVNRLNELASELLDVSKIRFGKLNYTITNFNFNDMIESTVESIQLTSAKHIIVKTGQAKDTVNGDEDRLQQVVINLLTNAIKYSPGAEKVVVNVEQNNDHITVSVKDAGIGIAQKSLDKIFEKYHRVEEHSGQFQGLGIGLFISYEIIQRHHGRLWAESEPGKGSTFYFTIPVHIKLQ